MITRVFGKKIENYYDVDHKWEQIKDNNGDFKTIEDIKNVSGIGEALFDKIKDFITV